MATKGKKVELYYTSQGTTTGIDASALIFDGKNLEIHTHGKVFKGTDTTYSAKTASGISLSGTQFSLNVGTKDSTNASSAAGFTSGRFYQVVPDKNNKLGVVVPWEDHNDDTWLPLTSSQAGYAPKASGGIDSQDSSTYYFLGYTGSSVNWFKLPANAFKNSTYHVYNGSFTIFGNGTSVASTSANASADSSVNIVAGSNVTITPDATNKKITIASKDTNTWDPVTSTVDGYVPKIGTAAASTIATQADEWVLASTKGGTPSWRKLPANAFKNDNTTYSFYNLAFQNTAGETVDTYKPSTSPSKTLKAGSANVLISAASNVISIDTKDTKYSDFVKSGSGAAAGLVPKPSTTAGTTKFLREDGTWSVPSYTTIPDNNVTGSGTSGYIAKFSGANTITNGPAFGTGTTFLRNDGTWQTPTNTWTAADKNNAGYVPKSVAGKFLHANASTGALEWIDDNDTNTWRTVKGNGTSIGSNTLNIKPGSGITVSVSGGDITITNSAPDQNHNTDANVSQSDSNANQNSPVLVKNGTGTGTVTSGVIFADGVTINPSTNSLSISGSLSVSGTASFGNNVTASGGISMGSTDLSFKGSDPGDIVWYNSAGSETERIWSQSGGGSLNYRTNAGSTYSLIHTGNISSQSVNYANSAGSVAWGNVSSKPSATGNATTPVYWNGSGFTNCTAYSSASVNYANSAGSTNIITRVWQRGNDCKTTTDFPYNNQTRFYMYDSTTSNKPTGAAGFMMVNGWDWGPGGSILAQNFDDGDYGRLYTACRPCGGSWSEWRKVAFTSDIPSTISWSNVTSGSNSNSYTCGHFTLSSTNPLTFLGSGSGTYNQAALYVSQSGGITFETPRASDSGSAATRGFHVKTRGGQYDNFYCANAYASSDRHLKKGIHSIDKRSLDDLFNVSDKLIKSFKWKQSGKASYGLIAQELEQWIPEAVEYVSKDTKTVNYQAAFSKIIAALVHKVKEQANTIEEIKSMLSQIS